MRIKSKNGDFKNHCSRCGKHLEEARAGKQRYCKSCHAEYMRQYRPKYSELNEDQRKKADARTFVKEYLKRGKITKSPCSVCGEIKSEAHHDNYDEPLNVVWLCRVHHMELHKRQKQL